MAVRMFTDTEFYLQKDGVTATSLTPTGITSAAPAEITVADTTGLTDGDVVVFKNTGFSGLDGRSFIITNITATTFDVVGSDTSAGGTLGASPEANVYARSGMVRLCLNSFEPQPGTPEEVDISTFCRPTATLPGVVSAGSATFGGFTDKDDAGYQELLKAEEDGNERVLLIVPNQNGYWIAPIVVGSVSWTYPLRSASEFSFSATFSDKLRHLF